MSLTITLFQTDLIWESKQLNLNHFTEQMSTVAQSDLMVLPEMFSTGFSMRSEQLAESMDDKTVQWMLARSAELDSIVCGSLIIKESGNFYNRFIWAQPDGNVQFYDKRHLFRMSEEHQNYSPGHQKIILDINGFKICPQVCYDLRFPVFSRNTQRIDGKLSAAYDLLLYVANWPAARFTHWRALLQARAIENQAYVIGVNRVGTDGNDIAYRGDSCVIDHQGEIVEDMGNQAGILSVTLDKSPLEVYRAKFPAWKDADQYQLI